MALKSQGLALKAERYCMDKFKIMNREISSLDDGSVLVQSPAQNDKHIEPPKINNPIIVNGAWYLDAYPTNMIIELESGLLKMAYITPMRPLSQKDLRDYKAYHPRKCKGQPLPVYLYKFYGLEKNDESATEVIHVRLTPSEKERADTAAKNDGKTISEMVRDFIKGL